MSMALASVVAAFSVAAAIATRPWRLLRGRVRIAAAAVTMALALMLTLVPTVTVAGTGLRWSGAALLVLLAGWPLATLALAAAAAVGVVASVVGADAALMTLCWYGLAPAWWALIAGWIVRRWLPRNPFVYIFARAFVATIVGVVGVGVLRDAGAGSAAIAHLLIGFAEGTITGMIVAALVAMRPEWLATYSDRIWAPPPAAAVPAWRRLP